MRLLLAGTFVAALGVACASRQSGPIQTQVVTFPEGGVVVYKGQQLGRAPATVILPQDEAGNLTERAEIRALPNTRQHALYAQRRILDPQERTSRVPDRVMIDLTLPGTNPPPTEAHDPAEANASEASSGERKPRFKAQTMDRGKPTRPVGIDRWNPGAY